MTENSDQRDAAEDRDAQRELRGHGRAVRGRVGTSAVPPRMQHAADRPGALPIRLRSVAGRDAARTRTARARAASSTSAGRRIAADRAGRPGSPAATPSSAWTTISRSDQEADRGVDAEHQLDRARRPAPRRQQSQRRRSSSGGHERAGDVEALAPAPGEVAGGQQRRARRRRGSAASIASSSSPSAKPQTAPMTAPPSRPSATTTTGNEVRRRAEHRDLREEGELEDHGDEDDQREPQRGSAG